MTISVAVLLSAVLLFSGYQLWRHYAAEKEAEDDFTDLAALNETPTLPVPPTISGEPEEPTPPQMTAYKKYAALFEQNPDMIRLDFH
ncbi:MAG: hypothetical protein LBU32_24260 [Clostridiales bacterium]|nr:hypothetical protein [Clostridiales bacterium]